MREKSMAIHEYKLVLGKKKYRNEQEVDALLRAAGGANDPPIKSLVLELNSPRGISSQQKLLQSLPLHGLECFSLNLEYSTGAESLGILASTIEAGKLPCLRKLQIFYREIVETKPPVQKSAKVHSNLRLKSSEEQLSSSSFSLLSALGSSSSSSSTLSSSSNGTESPQRQGNSKSGQAEAIAPSWKGFSLLAQILKMGLLPRLEAPIILEADWKSRVLGDTGSKSLSALIGTGFFSGLRELVLEDNSMGDDGMAAIADALREGKLLSLETLNLSRNCFSPAEGTLRVLNVVEANCLPSLKKLQLARAGCREVPCHETLTFTADEVVNAFVRNNRLTADVELDWPSRALQARWKKVRTRNAKLVRRLARSGQGKGPAGVVSVCGFPMVRTLLRLHDA